MTEKKLEPIWVESLLTAQEIRELSKVFNTYCPTCKKFAREECKMTWRVGMGANLTVSTIKLINARLDCLKIHGFKKLEVV